MANVLDFAGHTSLHLRPASPATVVQKQPQTVCKQVSMAESQSNLFMDNEI